MKTDNKAVINENQKWFNFFLILPKISALIFGIITFLMFLILGIICAIYDQIGLSIVFFLVGVLVGIGGAFLVYAVVKIACSYRVLHIYYLKKLSLSEKEEDDEEYNEDDNSEDNSYVLCKSCGFPVYSYEEVCSNCGTVKQTELEKEEDEEKEDDNFVNKNPFTYLKKLSLSEKEEDDEEYDEEYNEDDNSKENSFVLCKNCGFPVYSDEKVCSNCGTVKQVDSK